MEPIFKRLDRALQIFLISLMALMVVDVSWQVFSRYILNAPSSYTEEIARFLLIWIGLLGASYAYQTGAHLGIDIVINRLGEKHRKVTVILIHTISSIFALLVMIGGGLHLLVLAFEFDQRSAALNIPMGAVYVVVPLSGAFIVLYAFRSIFSDRLSHRNPDVID